jgi:hypothetical protein
MSPESTAIFDPRGILIPLGMVVLRMASRSIPAILRSVSILIN